MLDNIRFPSQDEIKKTKLHVKQISPDLSKLKSVYIKKINATIFIKPDQDENATIEKYIKRLEHDQRINFLKGK